MLRLCGLRQASGIDLKLLAHEAFPYPAALRRAVLAAMNAKADFYGGVGASELAAGHGVCRSGESDGRSAQNED